MTKLKITAALALALASAPAIAGPNAFWMFGWEWRYNHGTGGWADAADVQRRVQERSNARRTALATAALPHAGSGTARPTQLALNIDGLWASESDR